MVVVAHALDHGPVKTKGNDASSPARTGGIGENDR